MAGGSTRPRHDARGTRARVRAHTHPVRGRAAGATERGQRADAIVTTRDAALGYVARGWHVVPVRPSGKVPLTPHGVHDATTDPAIIAAWWARWPRAGVAIATGTPSGLIVLDIDPRHAGDDSLADLERRHGTLSDTPRVLTGGGGAHIYLSHPGGSMRCSVGALGLGLDIRADGGFVVAPPSGHASGRRYEWEIGAGPDDVPLAPVPPWILEGLRRGRSAGDATPSDEWAGLVRAGAAEGQRNDAVARLAGYLLRRRPAPRVVLELLRAWSASRCRPPLGDREIIATVDSIARREAARRRGH